MIIYLIKSSLCLSAFLLVYYFILERENMHVFKRFYLLISLVFSLLVPFITFEFQAENTVAFVSNSLQTVVLPVLEVTAEKSYLPIILYFIYGIITLILIARFSWNLHTIYTTRKKAEIINYENAKLALVDAEILPYTFGSTIYINKNDYKSQVIESELFTHELTHVRQKHSLDVVLIEVLKTLFWFNPLLILYKRAIQLNHEFLADESVIASHNTISMYQNLLLSKSMQTTNFYLTSNLTSFLKTKKRLIMMTKTTSITTQLFKKAIVAPLFLGMFIFGSSMTFAQEVPSKKSEKPVEHEEIIVQTVSMEDKVNPNDPNQIYNMVDKRPDFPGGIQAFYNFVGENYKTPDVKDLNGRIFIQFIVEADGSLTNLKSMRDLGHGTGEEAIRVLKLCPKWIPGEQDGKKVRVLYSLPISIKS